MKQLKYFFYTFLFSLLFLFSNAQKPPVTIQKDRLINLPFSDFVVGEPHLAINPNNSKHLLIGAMMWSTNVPSEITCISAVSFDGGTTWKRHRFTDKNAADPWCVITSKGEAVFSFLGKDSMWTYHSSNGGLSWKDSTSHGTKHDHETMTYAEGLNGTPGILYLLSVQAIKNSAGKGRESVYIARSVDGGKTFDHKTNLVHNNLWKNTMTPVVLSDGSLVLSFSEYAYRTADKIQVPLQKNNSWTISSKDSGKTFSEPRFITDRSVGFPVLERDGSTFFKDRLYWVTGTDGGKEIILLHSTNKGETWSKPVTVTNSAQVKTIPNIAVNNKGIVSVTWYEKSNEKHCQNFYFAYSSDGGKSFSQPFKISGETSCADTLKNARALTGGWSSGGHYTGLVADEDGNFIAVWADARSGRYQLYTTKINVSAEVQKYPVAKSEKLPSFTLPGLTAGTSIQSVDFNGRYLIIDFWATYCKTCIPKRKELEAIYEKYKDRLEILSISLDALAETPLKFQNEKIRMPWKNAFIQGNFDHHVAKLLGVDQVGLPSLFIISPDGILLHGTEEILDRGLLKIVESLPGMKK